LHTKATKAQAVQAVQDYEQALKLASREEWDTDAELLEDGARTNPYAAWEYGMALRLTGQYEQAQDTHRLASEYFDDIGDRGRSVISALDAGIDAAAMRTTSSSSSSSDTAIVVLKNAIARTKTVEARDIPLLQRVIAKEGEGRVALASLLWTSNEKIEAESEYGLACQRLEQLEVDGMARQKTNAPVIIQPPRLTFNIDDNAGALDISCTRLKNKDFLTDRLEWPEELQQKANKLYKLGQ
jgi:tetratricopeptide (TPR) repeat protein